MFHKSFLSNHLSVFNSEAATGGVLSGVCFGGFRGVHWGGVGCGVAGGGVAGLRPVALLMGRLWRGCFPVGFVGFLGAPFLQSTSGRLLLLIPLSYPLLTISPDNFLHKINNFSLGFNVLNFLQSKLIPNCGHLLN